MKKVSLKTCKFSFRIVLLICVLTGLLSSGGEGIRIFPFPTPEAKANATLSLNDGDKVPYQFSLHRFENNQVNYQLKFQRNNPHHCWINDHNQLNDLSFLTAAIRQKTGSQLNMKIFESRLFSVFPGSRAPPFIS